MFLVREADDKPGHVREADDKPWHFREADDLWRQVWASGRAERHESETRR